MLLFKKAFFVGLQSGVITLTFRRWARAKVKPGGRYRCHPIGVLEVDGITTVRARDITEQDAAKSGFPDRAALIKTLEEFGGPLRANDSLFRVELHFGGDGDRVQTALEDKLTEEDVAILREKLRGLDARSADGAWTKKAMKLIDKNPRIAASRLAPKMKRETQPFKADVVKLKKLGLTQSFEVGYELSPRGRAFVERTKWKW